MNCNARKWVSKIGNTEINRAYTEISPLLRWMNDRYKLCV